PTPSEAQPPSQTARPKARPIGPRLPWINQRLIARASLATNSVRRRLRGSAIVWSIPQAIAKRSRAARRSRAKSTDSLQLSNALARPRVEAVSSRPLRRRRDENPSFARAAGAHREHHPLPGRRRRRARQERAPRCADGTGQRGLRALERPLALRPERSRLAAARSLRALQRARVDAAVRAAPPVRLRP